MTATAGIAGLAVVAAVVAQSASGTYDLSWRALAGGGGSSGGNYGTQGVIGQTFAWSSTGGGYTVDGGFLGGSQVKFNRILPMLAKDGTN
ncbi:MAG: hypothetical protein FIB00_14405 [Chloroflexi bacterium]|nr:hypothetical protein [Dehalococcoidia bacterium]MCZ7576880.1 hypothetical protein [Dehalococcoidia bacterium]NJD66406.1 hypothetical protein [Chloroflexota bacterium]